ncbi:Intraflagellar transport protein 140 like [Pseudolycoriella hygida]|uniref:Intraflagellar transport protein 140 like n=1 Tax=Pseudolycoriella hygida TaxID=35572 RepID=A0A9Q0MZW8_9DIPT|nr:Intraflagellar transport protein 140 like [Pseudolycoriella hygida]
MTLYFDTKVQFLDAEAVSTIGACHPREPLIAVASYSQDQGGSVTIFDDSGEPIKDVTFPVHPTSQASAICWHSDKKLLVTGWENGEVHAWFGGNREFSAINGPHKSPIVFLEFSEQGGRMVTADSNGVLTGWRCDSQGHFLTMFTHDLRDPILHVTFRRTVLSVVSTEISNLAKAAVAGDESALDVLTNWRPRTAARNLAHVGVKDNHCFFVGTESGIIYYLNQSGTCTEVLQSSSAIFTQLLWHPKREAIVGLMDDMTVCHFLVESNGNLTELDKVKLSGRVSGHKGCVSWAGNAMAIINGDFSVRIWDIDTSDHFLLPTSLPNTSKTSPIQISKNRSSTVRTGTTTATTTQMEVFTCIAYCSDNQTLCAGTNQGNLYTWKRTNYSVDVPENTWQLNNISAVRGAIKQCTWGVCETVKPCIMVNCIANVYILKEQPLVSAHCREIWATQRNANQVYVHNDANKSTYLQADANISITDLCLTKRNMLLTNGRTVVVYKITIDDDLADAKMNKGLSIKLMNTFAAECIRLFIHDENIIVLGQIDVKIFSLGGVVLRELHFNDNEGKPIGADLTTQYLTVFTMNGFIKIFDVSKHEPKLLTKPKSAYDMFPNFGEIISAKCNSNGTVLAITIANEQLIPDGLFYTWHIEKDTLSSCDFLGKNGNQSQSLGHVARLPTNFYWDTDDSRLFACEARLVHTKSKNGIASSLNKQSNAAPLDIAAIAASTESIVSIMFVTEKCEIKDLESLSLLPGEQLINLCAPNVVTLRNCSVELSPMGDFHGLTKCDTSTRQMVIDFSLHVVQGNMDQAFRCIRSIQSDGVWQNLAKMCVHTGRLDVARVCLGHMKKARSVRALRKALADNTLENEAKVAVLAIELDMIDDAEALYKKCGRYDLLNKLLQACGRFEDALKIAEQLDRVHLKNTYYKYAEHLKGEGDILEALNYYGKANNPTHNVTQMLIEDPVALRNYMQSTSDKNLLKWWAQYIESTGDMESAFKVYQRADDWFSQVRILCFLGQLSRADSVARLSGDKSACYHLARHYENIGKIQEAIQFYTRAQTFSNAVRICKENDLQNELWNVANSARSRDKASAASYFEECGDFKRAVELYHRSGMLHKAVEMAFASQQPETLQVIASELDVNSDAELVTRCADFFLGIDQLQKAVHLLANAKHFEKALEICKGRAVPVTETLAELLTPAKDEIAEPTRVKILTMLGDILQEQGDYHTATKKFTQAGDKTRAMKSLLKSGDTDKIVFFAGMSRQKEIYIMAANYLQALNWQNDAKILKNIVTFYTKGQAYDLLANFYVTCAQVEIDEFRDYEKALKALLESSKCLTKIQNVQRASDNLQNTIMEVRKVLEVQEALERGEWQNVVTVCKSILAQPERPPIRHSDIQGFLITSLIKMNQFSDALAYLRDLALKVSDWSSKELVERSLVAKLAKECGIDFDAMWASGRKKRYVDDADDAPIDFVEEEVQEDFE